MEDGKGMTASSEVVYEDVWTKERSGARRCLKSWKGWMDEIHNIVVVLTDWA